MKFDVTTLLSPGVPLSLKTLKRRSGLPRRAIHAAVYQALDAGTVRRVNPSEVGSNKFHAPIPADWDVKSLKNTPQLQNFQRQLMNVFVLV